MPWAWQHLDLTAQVSYRRINLFTTKLQVCLHADIFLYPILNVYLLFNRFFGRQYSSVSWSTFKTWVSLQPMNNLKSCRSFPATAVRPKHTSSKAGRSVSAGHQSRSTIPPVAILPCHPPSWHLPVQQCPQPLPQPRGNISATSCAWTLISPRAEFATNAIRNNGKKGCH